MSVFIPTATYVRQFGDAEVLPLGATTLGASQELIYVRVKIYIHNLTPTTQRIRVKAYSDSGYTKTQYTSAWSNLSDITYLSGGYFFGWVRVTFAREWLKSGVPYYLGVELGNYTFNASSWVGVEMDTYYPQNTSSAGALRFQLYGYR